MFGIEAYQPQGQGDTALMQEIVTLKQVRRNAIKRHTAEIAELDNRIDYITKVLEGA